MTWLASAWPQVLDLAITHLLLAGPAVVLSVLVAVPVGRLAHRHPRVGGALLATASLTQAPYGPIAISDLDGDGNKDLAVTRIGTPVPEIWSGNGLGGFVKAE